MANIKDVARIAGVGIATVSRVINNSGYVKEETRLKIESVIREIGYLPNEIARSMTKQRSYIVAFVLPENRHIFFSELLFQLEATLFKHGYKVMLCNSSESIEKELFFLDMLRNSKVDALILLTNNDVEKYLSKDLSLVSFDRRFKDVPFVASDNYHGGVLAAKKLYELGCKKFMFIGDDAQGENTEVTTEVTKRRVGFIEYLNSVGVTDIINIEYPLKGYHLGDEELYDMIKNHLDVDGIFAVCDAVASSLVRVLENNGKQVPLDCKVIGFDGERSALNLGKNITSISQDTKKIAEAFTDIILKYENNEEIENLIIPVELLDGDTT